MENILIQIQNISQIYQTGKKPFVALENIDLDLREKEFIALLGPSGCGKSTLLRIITGLQPPTKGAIIYKGKVLRGVNPHATIVFQTFALFPWLTVQENVEIALKARGVPKAQREKRALDLLDRVGLDGFESAYPRELSGGMRQKVGFARAMAVEPELLCMDEPFSALDPLSADALRGELIELWTSGNIPTKTILMVTHNIEEAVFMADRIVIMDKSPGRVVAQSPINLPHPRNRKSPEFLEMVDWIYALMAGQTQPEEVEMGTAPGEPGQTRSIPIVSIGDLAGLLERLSEIEGGRCDIYQLASSLHVKDSDQLLRLTEAAELLGFATIVVGDITLTTLGETFAEASILTRKEIFASRIKRLPIFKWILEKLEKAERHELEIEELKSVLEEEFPPEEAEKQIKTIINWGRYAELFAYDDVREVIYLENQNNTEKAINF